MAPNPQTNLDVIIRGVDTLSPELQKIESKVIRVVGAIGASLAALRVAAFPITSAAAFDREMANVAKTTNFTSTEIKRLGDDILRLSLTLGTSAEDLAKVAAAAGQQGLGRQGVEGILAFTGSVSRMASVLDIAVEDASDNIGKLINIFKLPMDQLEKVVSSFNQTSNNTTASGKDLLDVVRRLGDASGTLNLQQSVGLAASALDFGTSPEVAGTALSKMFASMLQKADQFTAQIRVKSKEWGHITSKEWVDLVSKDGVQGFKIALDAIRQMEKSAQQDAIVKLFGAGRIGSLANKYVQDSDNAVMDRDLSQAMDGYANGISALREQATVLNTLSEQSKILFNSIKKDAIEAGQQLTGPLITDVKQLSAALQDPGVRSFINNLVKSVGDLIHVFVEVGKAVGSLNINWENLVTVGKAWVGMKLFNVASSMLGSFSGLDSAMKTLKMSADGAAEATGRAQAGTGNKGAAAAAEEAATSWQKCKASVNELIARQRASEDLIYRQKAALQDLATTQAAVSKAMSEESVAGAVATSASGVATVQGRGTAAAHAAVGRAIETHNAEVAAVQEAFDQRMLQRAQQHEQALAELEVRYQEERRAAKALGRSKAAVEEQTAVEAANIKRIEQEELSYQRSVRAIEQNWRARLAATVAGGRAIIAAEEENLLAARMAEAKSMDAALIATQEFYDKQAALVKAGTQRMAVEREAAATGVPAGSAPTGEQGSLIPGLVGSAETAASRFSKTIKQLGETGKKAMQTIALGLNALRYGLQAVAEVAVRAFFWVSIVYTIADAFGLIDKLGKSFVKLTDYIGLTSASQRRLAVEASENRKAQLEHIALLDEEISRYQKLTDLTKGGVYTDALAKEAANRAGNDTLDSNTRQAGVTELLTAYAGVRAKMEKMADTSDKSIAEQHKVALEKSIADDKKALEEAQRSLASSEASSKYLDYSTAGGAAAANDILRNIDTQKERVISLTREIGKQTDQLAFYQRTVSGVYDQQNTDTAAEAERIQKSVGTLFTPESARVAVESLTKISDAVKNAALQQDKYKEAVAHSNDVDRDKNATEADKAEAYAASMEQQRITTAANIDVEQTRRDLLAKVNTLLADGTVRTEQQIKALKDLPSYGQRSAEEMDNLAEALRKVGGAQLLAPALAQLASMLDITGKTKAKLESLFTGENAGSGTKPPASGDADKAAKDEASAVARARIKLQNAKIEAETALAREKNAQLQAEDDHAYSLGLQSMKAYYKERERIALQVNTDEIEARKREMAELNAAEQAATKESEKLQYQAQQVKLNGAIAVLQEHRKEISEDAKRDLADATRDFNDQVAMALDKAYSDMAMPGTVAQKWTAAMQAQTAQYRVQIDKLRSESEQLRKDGDLNAANARDALALALRATAAAQAMDNILQGINNKVDLQTNAISQYQRALEVLRGEGAMTSLEAELAYSAAIERTLPLLKDQLAQQEAQLELYRQDRATTPELYAKQQQAVNETRLQIAELGQQAHQTARTINEGITNSLTDALMKIRPTMKSLKDTVIGFLSDIAKQMQQTFAKDIAESIMGGKGGAGGIGGLWEKFLSRGKTPGIVPEQQAGSLGGLAGTAASAALGITPGSTRANPLWVQDINGPALGESGTATQDTFGIMAQGVGQQVGGPTGGAIGAGLGGLFSGLFGGGQPGGGAGATPSQPVWTKDADAGATGFGLLGAGKKQDDGAAVAKPIVAALNTTTDKSIAAGGTQSTAVATGIGAATMAVGASVGGGFGQLLSLLGSAIPAIITAIMTPKPSSGGGGGASSSGMGWAGMLGSMFGTYMAEKNHVGGVLGATTNRRMAVSAGAFANAMRYHTGGIIGLPPDEMPMIGKKGEEVLTENNPRHRNNVGAAGGGGSPVQMSQTLVFDSDAAAKAILTGNNLITAVKPNVKALRQLLGVK